MGLFGKSKPEPVRAGQVERLAEAISDARWEDYAEDCAEQSLPSARRANAVLAAAERNSTEAEVSAAYRTTSLF